MLQKKPTEAFTFFLNVFKLCQNYRIYELIYDTYGNFLVTEHNIFLLSTIKCNYECYGKI